MSSRLIALSSALTKFDLTLWQAEVLTYYYLSPGLSMAQLAEELNVSYHKIQTATYHLESGNGERYKNLGYVSIRPRPERVGKGVQGAGGWLYRPVAVTKKGRTALSVIGQSFK